MALLAVGGFATACGGSSASSSATTTPSTTVASSATGTRATSRAKFTSCLEGKGVPASVASTIGGGFGRGTGGAPGGGGGTGFTPPTTTAGSPPQSFTRTTIASQYQAAFTACRSLLPTGRFGGGGGISATALKTYENCLEANGVTIPTTVPTTAPASGTTPGFGGGGFGTLQGLRSQPAYAAAAAKCQSLLPFRGGAATTTTVPAA